ncbi:MAG TPA: peptidylprolyl isomerase [Patescibacteria group bacterium]|jgi:cyclophilin family peptidyl-prolyl cis-trans isomerase|nr:peptidylprolyl isomerase [Patescibacteria group bacterium]
MKTWQIVLLIVIVVAAIGGIVLITKGNGGSNNNTNNSNTASDIQSNDNSNATDQSNNANANSNNSNANQQASNSGNCVRNVDNKTMQEPIDIKNKFVTLHIKDYGDIKLQLFDTDAPKTVENFLRLTKSGYYDCLTFHRMIPGFMIQGGDPTGKGTGGTSAFGGEFADELNPNTASYKTGYVKGVLAMANHGPNTNGSQFFIMLADTPLPNDYTIFGKVVVGQNVVDKMGEQGTPSGQPKSVVSIDKATISDK